MKKLVTAALMLASSLAFAGAPAPSGTARSKAKPRPAVTKTAPLPEQGYVSDLSTEIGTTGTSTAAPTTAVRGTGAKKAKPSVDTSSAGK